MKRIWAGMLCLLLLGRAGAWAGQAYSKDGWNEAKGFWWDVGDGEITIVSSGTGGTLSDAPGWVGEAFWTWRLDAMEEAYPEIGRRMAEWRTSLPIQFSSDACEYMLLEDGLAIACWRGLLDEDEEDGRSVDYQRWRVRTLAFNAQTGEEARLSDLFYDGVNYIRHINEKLSLSLPQEELVELYTTTVTEENLRRPFSGFPRDYPYFHLTGGAHGGTMLALEIDQVNPLFSLSERRWPTMVWVPLTPDISPYGTPWMDVKMFPREIDMGQEWQQHWEEPEATLILYEAQVHLGEGYDKTLEGKVNGALAALARQAERHPNRVLQSPRGRLSPYVSFAPDTLRAGYYAERYSDGGSYDVALLGTIEIDLSTGESVYPEGWWVNALQSPAARFLRREPGEDYREEKETPRYCPPEDALYLGTFERYDRYEEKEYLRVAWLDPAGYEAFLELPLGARGVETDLRTAPASEGRTVMEEGLEALGITIAPYEITHEDWKQRGLTRYQMYAESSPYSTHQLVDGQDRLIDSALFFNPGKATEAEMAWAEEHLRDVWALTLRTVYPELSDEQAEELIDRMENNLAKETYDVGPFYDDSGLPAGQVAELIKRMDGT